MKKAHSVSIVIPNWNGRHLLEKNLPSVIAAAKNTKNRILEVIVVDDFSQDDSLISLKAFKSEIRLIKHTKNRGFAAAVNTGVRMAKGSLVCLLNTDVSVTSEFLAKIISHFDDDKVFGVCLHEEGHGPAVGHFKNGFIDHKGGKEKDEVQRSFWVSGGSGVFSREKWMELKGMDEELLSPFYWEDLDLSYRAAKRGYQILWEPDSLVYHNHEGVINTSHFKKVYMDRIKERNELLVLWKNLTSKPMRKRHVRGLVSRIVKHPGYMRIAIMAMKKRKEVRAAYKRELKETKVSDESIFAQFS